MGYYFARSHFAGKTPGFFHIALFIPILLHGLYDFFLFVMVELAIVSEASEEASDGEILLVLGCFILTIVTLGYSLRKAYSSVQEMRKEQDAM